MFLHLAESLSCCTTLVGGIFWNLHKRKFGLTHFAFLISQHSSGRMEKSVGLSQNGNWPQSVQVVHHFLFVLSWTVMLVWSLACCSLDYRRFHDGIYEWVMGTLTSVSLASDLVLWPCRHGRVSSECPHSCLKYWVVQNICSDFSIRFYEKSWTFWPT